MAALELLSPIPGLEGQAEEENALWVGLIRDHLDLGDNQVPVGMFLTDQQMRDIEQGCKVAFEAR
jgi:hypothetical protein